MKVAILGAGPAGCAMAALIANREHEVTLWSPRGGGTRHLGANLVTRGVLEGSWRLRIAADLGRALDQAELVLVALPGHVLAPLLHRLATVLVGNPDILLTPPGALAPLLLRNLALSRGISPRVGALPVPPVAARREADGATHIVAIRPRIWLGSLPVEASPRLIAILDEAFGLPVERLADVLAAALAEPAPLIGAAQLFAPQGVPNAAGRLLLGLAAERDALAEACGRGSLPSIAELVMEQGGLPEAALPLAEVAAGLAFLDGLARATRTPAPLIGAALQLLEGATGERLSPHPLMAELDAESLAKALG
ncbi:MAG: octopine/nopaline dehydrogenase [Rubritepida sp.]|nr:octopine/nopaline dehydrogenase [Rubritepida sp.]